MGRRICEKCDRKLRISYAVVVCFGIIAPLMATGAVIALLLLGRFREVFVLHGGFKHAQPPLILCCCQVSLVTFSRDKGDCHVREVEIKKL